MKAQAVVSRLSQNCYNNKVVIEMNCLICVGTAERVMCDGPWEERDCPECGRYRISDELILALMDQGQIFDVLKVRGWLDTRRTEGFLPCIQSPEGLLVTFIESSSSRAEVK